MEIILYQAEGKAGKLRPKIGRLPTKKVLKIIGCNLIVIAFLLTAVIVVPMTIQEVRFRMRRFISAPSLVRQADQNVGPDLPHKIAEEAALLKVSPDFSIVIPKINAKAKIIPNINPADEKQYKEALKQGVAHAAGTKFPGNQGTVYLFAHSANTPLDIARYNAVFYLLKELEKNDEIIIFFAGQKFVYRVEESFVTDANDTRWLSNLEKKEILVLQTCWPPGTTQKRLIVTAKPL